MGMTMTLSILLIISALLGYVILQAMYMSRKYKMHKKEEILKKSGNNPFGSGLCHGMVLNSEKNGVISDSKKSPAWYSRLVQ